MCHAQNHFLCLWYILWWIAFPFTVQSWSNSSVRCQHIWEVTWQPKLWDFPCHLHGNLCHAAETSGTAKLQIDPYSSVSRSLRHTEHKSLYLLIHTTVKWAWSIRALDTINDQALMDLFALITSVMFNSAAVMLAHWCVNVVAVRQDFYLSSGVTG